MSISAPPPPPSARKRALRPWYFIAAMVLGWLVGVMGLSDSFATLALLHEGSLPDVDALVRALPDDPKPLQAALLIKEAVRLHALADASKLAFPLMTGRFLLSILLVIATGMAMSGRRGARSLAMQALVANVALSLASFWLLRESRFAWIDQVARIREGLLALPVRGTPEEQQVWALALDWLDRRTWIFATRAQLALFEVGGLLLAAATLTSPVTKAFFEAAAEAQEQTEDS